MQKARFLLFKAEKQNKKFVREVFSEGQKAEKHSADCATTSSGQPQKLLPANSARSHENASKHKADEELCNKATD